MTDKLQRFAFSLIELLVVISIISAILSISLPVLQRGRKKAKFVICKSNLKQNYNILSIYANNNNNSWPQTDYPSHTNQFYSINSQKIHGPIYYLWLNGYLQTPKTWYCPSGKDKFKDNWKITGGKLQPGQSPATSGYQYRMFFAFNWPKRRLSARGRKKSGTLKPDQHRNLATWTDAFGTEITGRRVNHKDSGNWNVLFNDSSVKTRTDKTGLISKLDLSWHQAGDWRVCLPDGRADTFHNAATLWHFFDTGSWTLDGKKTAPNK